MARYGTLAAAIIAALVLGGAADAETDFLDRFNQSWSGKGKVQRNAKSGVDRVSCDLTGNRAGNRVAIAGTCRAYLVFSRTIAADLTFDPDSGEVTGTYTGSRAGVAKLSGRREGDTVRLAMRWPRPVNGDTEAAMTIRTSENGSLRIVVSDALEPGGAVAAVTDVALEPN
ncbi:hypothetical protein [Chthonobacter rhizosphaerae]|uniref:hypothetical protein n=1 Tax=Chthonobacter rhizosphaerae TaxID=2735553 RepID=UPI0015EEDF81|nr:hypothetical protein [Chthonobacter rhizosphaerae]